jgi:integrase
MFQKGVNVMVKKKSQEELPPKVRKRGRGYTYRYEVPIIKPDGTPGRKQKDTVQYPTADEAYKAGIVIEAKLIEGKYIDEKNILFTDWAERGMELYASSAKKPKDNTVDVRRSNLKYAKISFAGKKLKDITTHMYQMHLLELRDKYNLGNSAIVGAHAAMCILFRLAVKLGVTAHDPTKDATIPSVELTFEELEELADQEEFVLPEFLEKEQLAVLLRTAKQQADAQKDPIKAFGARQHFRTIYLLAHTGLRIGELCALEKKRSDTKNRTIRIIATLYYRMGVSAYKLTPPKTKKSIRTVDISQSVASVLENQLHDLKVFRLLIGETYYKQREFTIVNYKALPGYPLNPDTFNDDLIETLKRANLPTSITAHSLRHTFTSLSAEAGAPLDDIQKQLGHAKDEMTRSVYLHTTEARRRSNVEKLDNLLNNLLADLN